MDKIDGKPRQLQRLARWGESKPPCRVRFPPGECGRWSPLGPPRHRQEMRSGRSVVGSGVTGMFNRVWEEIQIVVRNVTIRTSVPRYTQKNVRTAGIAVRFGYGHNVECNGRRVSIVSGRLPVLLR